MAIFAGHTVGYLDLSLSVICRAISHGYCASVKLIVEAAALKFMSRMPKHDAAALRQKLAFFAAAPYASHSWAKALKGRIGVRVRHGDWRAICDISDDHQEVIVTEVGNRKDIYR